MTKAEALEQIKNLQRFVEELDKPKVKLNTITEWPTSTEPAGRINGKWAFTIIAEEREGGTYEGAKLSGHKASMFLSSSSGTWYTTDGVDISGSYLYFKPD